MKEKKNYYDGVVYQKLIDPLLKDVRKLIADFIQTGSSVIDIGCGTGSLAYFLAQEKKCSVTGVDHSHEMISQAKKRKSKADLKKVDFIKTNAIELNKIFDEKFDFATISMMIHEMPETLRLRVISEALRVAKKLIIADYNTNQPFNLSSVVVQGIEFVAGREHYKNFKSFGARGGLDTLIKQAELIIHQETVNWNETIRIVVAYK